MTVTFNTLEVLEIAEQIERNGALFYRRAAEIFDGSDICKMFIRLADWEIKHEQVFAHMRKQLSELSQELRTLKSEDALPDPKVMAGLAVFGIRPNPADELSGKESKVDILRKGIEKEKDSIVFYNGLKDFVPAEAGKDKIDDIIKEEMRHIKILNRFQKRIK
ncbi:MAG: ferritin-like domain-containing protein [Planctomycetota bacterium]|jgi:rubrerythrin